MKEGLYRFRFPISFTYFAFLVVANVFGIRFVFENPALLLSFPKEIILFVMFHFIFGFLLFRGFVLMPPIMFMIILSALLRAGFRLYSVHLPGDVMGYFEISEHLLFFLCLFCFVMFLQKEKLEETQN